MRNPPLPVDGYKLRQYRKNKGWAQKHLAKAAGLSISQISLMERGKAVDRELSIRPVADALGIEPGEITNGYIPSPAGKESSAEDNKRRRGTASVVISESYEAFANSPELQRRIQEIVKAAKFRHCIIILGTFEDNSVRVELDCDYEDMQRLYRAYRSNELAKFGVMRVDVPERIAVDVLKERQKRIAIPKTLEIPKGPKRPERIRQETTRKLPDAETHRRSGSKERDKK